MTTFSPTRRPMSRTASGKRVYEPKYTIEPCADPEGVTVHIIRLHGRILSIGCWRNRADAVTAIKRLWRPAATGATPF